MIVTHFRDSESVDSVKFGFKRILGLYLSPCRLFDWSGSFTGNRITAIPILPTSLNLGSTQVYNVNSRLVPAKKSKPRIQYTYHASYEQSNNYNEITTEHDVFTAEGRKMTLNRWNDVVFFRRFVDVKSLMTPEECKQSTGRFNSLWLNSASKDWARDASLPVVLFYSPTATPVLDMFEFDKHSSLFVDAYKNIHTSYRDYHEEQGHMWDVAVPCKSSLYPKYQMRPTVLKLLHPNTVFTAKEVSDLKKIDPNFSVDRLKQDISELREAFKFYEATYRDLLLVNIEYAIKEKPKRDNA